jgi:hypothetical protein
VDAWGEGISRVVLGAYRPDNKGMPSAQLGSSSKVKVVPVLN